MIWYSGSRKFRFIRWSSSIRNYLMIYSSFDPKCQTESIHHRDTSLLISIIRTIHFSTCPESIKQRSRSSLRIFVKFGNKIELVSIEWRTCIHWERFRTDNFELIGVSFTRCPSAVCIGAKSFQIVDQFNTVACIVSRNRRSSRIHHSSSHPRFSILRGYRAWDLEPFIRCYLFLAIVMKIFEEFFYSVPLVRLWLVFCLVTRTLFFYERSSDELHR